MKLRVIFNIVFIVVISLFFLFIAFYSYTYLDRYLHRNDWKTKTTPLNQRKIEILCTNFRIDKQDFLCNGTQSVYGPDFIDIIRDTFRPYEAYQIPSSESATYYEVEEKIGIFREEECRDTVTTGDGFTFFRCEYDLRGDGKFTIGIIFTYPEMATFRVMMTPLYGE